MGGDETGLEWKGWREEDWPGLERMGRNGRSGEEWKGVEGTGAEWTGKAGEDGTEA